MRTFFPQVLCFSVPNGSGVSAAGRLRLVHEGLLAGVPDLILMDEGPRMLALEFKRPDGKGVVSKAQNRVIERFNELGATAVVVNSVDEAKEAFGAWWSQRIRQTTTT